MWYCYKDRGEARILKERNYRKCVCCHIKTSMHIHRPTCVYMYICLCVHVSIYTHEPLKTMIMLPHVNVIDTISSFLDYWFTAVVLGSGDESFGDWKLCPFSLHLQAVSPLDRGSWGAGCPEEGASDLPLPSGNLSFSFSENLAGPAQLQHTWLTGASYKGNVVKKYQKSVFESEHPVSERKSVFSP